MIRITLDPDSMTELIDLARVATLTPGRASPMVTASEVLRAVLAATSFDLSERNVGPAAGGGAEISIELDELPDETTTTFFLERLAEADKVPVARRMMSRGGDIKADAWVEEELKAQNRRDLELKARIERAKRFA